jgi:hypothetical protein
MEIKQKLLKYTKTESYLDYPTYRIYALIKLGEVPFNKRIDVYMKKHLKAKKAIDDKYDELMMLAKENDRLKKAYKEEPESKSKKKREKVQKEELDDKAVD